MYQFQMQVLNAMTTAAQSFGEAYFAAWKIQAEQFSAAAAQFHPAPRDSVDQAKTSEAFQFAEIPASGQSWYRKPFDNPVLAFWQEALRPWQSAWTGAQAWPGLSPASFASPWGSVAQFPFAPWLAFWQAAAEQAARGADIAGMTSSIWSGPQYVSAFPAVSPSSGPTLAKVTFPDQTEVTISLPFAPPFFGFPFTPPRWKS